MACSESSASDLDEASQGGSGGAAASRGGSAGDGPSGEGESAGSGGEETASCERFDGWATGGTACMTDVDGYPDPFTVAATLCPTKPDVTIGPCHTTSDERVDISNGIQGIPLRMALRIVDPSCNAVSGAVVEVWHTNYLGGYSGDINQMCTLDEVDEKSDFFRGYQITDANGVVHFNSCFPGWYRGRAVHIHVRVLTSAYDGADNAPAAAVTQLLWADDFVDGIFTNVPLYAALGRPDTHLDDDNVVGDVSDQAAFLFETQQMDDGTMLCSKTIVIDA
jgi:protocatechuate 3,4-dioxygenase beta subunit